MSLNSANITFRHQLTRELYYEELDENFNQLRILIDDYQDSFVLFQGWKDDAEAAAIAAEGSYDAIVAIIDSFGTIASQDANNVNITGGTINGVDSDLSTFTNPTITDADISGGTITDLDQPMEVADGGIGVSTLTQYGLLYGNNADPIQVLAPSDAGWILKSGGAGAPPVWEQESFVGFGSEVASGNTILDANSGAIQIITPTKYNESVTLPDATTVSVAAHLFTIVNDGDYTLVVKNDSGQRLGYIMPGDTSVIGSADDSTADGNWVCTNLQPFGVIGNFQYNSTFLNTGANSIQTIQIDDDRILVVSNTVSVITAVVVNTTLQTTGAPYTITGAPISYALEGNLFRIWKSTGDNRLMFAYVSYTGSINRTVIGYFTISGNTVSIGDWTSKTTGETAVPVNGGGGGTICLNLIETDNFYCLSYISLHTSGSDYYKFFLALPKTWNLSKISGLYSSRSLALSYFSDPNYVFKVDANRLFVFNYSVSMVNAFELLITDGIPITITNAVTSTSIVQQYEGIQVKQLSNTYFFVHSAVSSGGNGRYGIITRNGSTIATNGFTNTEAATLTYNIGGGSASVLHNTAGTKICIVGNLSNGSEARFALITNTSGVATCGTIAVSTIGLPNANIFALEYDDLSDKAYFVTINYSGNMYLCFYEIDCSTANPSISNTKVVPFDDNISNITELAPLYQPYYYPQIDYPEGNSNVLLDGFITRTPLYSVNRLIGLKKMAVKRLDCRLEKQNIVPQTYKMDHGDLIAISNTVKNCIGIIGRKDI